MTTATASIEKVVRKVLDQELDRRNEATLEAIERMSRVLTEEVIPRLGDDTQDAEDSADAEDDAPASGNVRSRAMRASAQRPGEDDEAPDDPEGDDASAGQAVPAAVSEAFDALYASLDADQAEALAALFGAIAQGRNDEFGPPEEAEEPSAQRPQQSARPRQRLAT
jgi:hypothetical protein